MENPAEIQLEETFLKLFKKLDIEAESSSIEDCHWLPSKRRKRIIVKFSKWKNAKGIRKDRKNLKGMDLSLISIRSPV